MSSLIHHTAIVDSQAEIANGVEIGAYSIIGPYVKLGPKVKIGPHVVIDGHTTVGEETQVFQFASIGSPPQDLKFKGEPSTLVIGARNKIREFVTLSPGTEKGTMTTIIGDENLFMASCHVGHDCRVGNNNVFANSAALAGHVTVYNGVILGGMVGVHQFCRVGSNAIISAGAMLAQDVPPYCIGQGDRCCLRGINLIGLKRMGLSDSEIGEIKKVYRLLFAKTGNFSEKIKSIPKELAQKKLIKEMLDFINISERGICSPAKLSSE